MEGGIEGSIILAQTGLELICWVLLVEDIKSQNKEPFDKLSASKKFEALLGQMEIDTAIPNKLAELLALSSKKAWKNGPEAIAGYRNTIVHPKRRAKNADVVIDASWEILELSLWYLELSLLYLFDYQGYYVNRINAKWAGVVEKVPWSNKSITPS